MSFLSRIQSPLQLLAKERSALATALIVAVALVGLFRAPLWAVLAGCGLAFVAIVVRAGQQSRRN